MKGRRFFGIIFDRLRRRGTDEDTEEKAGAVVAGLKKPPDVETLSVTELEARQAPLTELDSSHVAELARRSLQTF
jgi:uncharacterized small protein (DUF1192 family)